MAIGGTKVTAFLDSQGNLHPTEEAAIAQSISTLGKQGIQRILTAKETFFQPNAQDAILRCAEMIKEFRAIQKSENGGP